MGKFFYAFWLCIALAALWLTLSGRISHVLILSFGAGSIAFTVMLVARMGILDDETSPYHRLPRLAAYWARLFVEMAKANFAVARTVLSVNMDITPRMLRTPIAARTDFGRTVFANSITLTPGTVAVQVDDGEILVHALDGTLADPEGFQQIGRQSAWAGDAPQRDGSAAAT